MRPLTDRPILRRLAALAATAFAAVTLVSHAHAADATHVDNPHGKFKDDCQLCHSSKGWKDVKISPRFDHGKYGFPLKGAHASANCMGCHATLEFAQSNTRCASCHQDPHQGEMGSDCARCHGARSFLDRAPMVRAHAQTRFPLTGTHLSMDCEDCHKPAAQGQMQFVATSTQCYGCHQAQFATAPSHVSSGFSTQCQTCHTTARWNILLNGRGAFDHAAAGFPLNGAHALNARQCDDCHHGTYVGTSKDCASCHTTSTPGFNNPGAGAPAHNATYFPPAQCATCHAAAAANLTSWAGGTYTHQVMQLTNAHAGRACEDCHKGNYTTVAFNCYACHQPAYATGTPVVHTPANFPTDNASCQNCHNTTAWSPSLFPANHSTTAFAAQFRGAHLALACTDCHNASSWNVQGTGNNCYGCHTTDYANTNNPKHNPANFPTAGCACHSLTAWSPANGFDHTAVGFPLSGLHGSAVRQCDDCHKGNYTSTSPDCYSCHAASNADGLGYSTAAPPHNTTYFPTDTPHCTSCHTSAAAAFTSWSGGTYTHQTMQLTNAHAGRACEDCHKGNYTTVAFNCYACHQPAYAAGTPVIHSAADNFGTDNASCQNCHNTTAWSPSLFPANHSTTAFAAGFAGAHLALACTDCHNASSWNVQGTGNNCYGCHTADYAGTTNPKHDPVNFPTPGCACHSLTAWSPANGFDHTAAGFPLTGLHSTAVRQCADCHTASGYATGATSKDCYTCHANSNADGLGYSTAAPPHNTTYFPTDTPHCTSCHTSAAAAFTSWSGGTYTHQTMQLTNAHAGRACEDCHKGNYTTVAFNCYACHQPAYAAGTPVIHSAADNFGTDNASCQNCHNTTAWSPSLFPANHSTTAFAANMTGAHLALACTDCHNASSWNVQGTGNNCYGCHTADYAGTTNPKHDTVNFPTAGCVCHTTTAWSPATGSFDHTAAGFPLTGNHAMTVRTCNDCHAATGYGTGATSMDCYSCHANSVLGIPGYNTNTVVKHTTPNFPTATANCIGCHASANTSHLSWSGGTFATHTSVTTNFALTGNHAALQCSDCHIAAATDLSQYTCSVSCHNVDNRFVQHENKTCAGTSFTTAKTNPAIPACYSCHPKGTSSSPCG